jgi:hypothetical protein
MYKSATKCNKTVGKWCKNKHGASKIIDTLETYQPPLIKHNLPMEDLGTTLPPKEDPVFELNLYLMILSMLI